MHPMLYDGNGGCMRCGAPVDVTASEGRDGLFGSWEAINYDCSACGERVVDGRPPDGADSWEPALPSSPFYNGYSGPGAVTFNGDYEG